MLLHLSRQLTSLIGHLDEAGKIAADIVEEGDGCSELQEVAEFIYIFTKRCRKTLYVESCKPFSLE